MTSQATFISFPLNPAHNVPLSAHPFIHDVCERRLTVTVRNVVPDVGEEIEKGSRYAHSPIKSIAVRYVDPFIFI